MEKGDRRVKWSSIESYKSIKEQEQEKEKEPEIEIDDRYIRLNFKHYAKTNTDELKLILPDLSKTEKIVLFSVLPYVGYDDCLLKHSNGRELNIESISAISGLSESTVEDVVEKLRHKDILYKGKNSRNVQYFINPWICSRGSKLNKVLKTMFKNYYIRTLGKKWSELEK